MEQLRCDVERGLQGRRGADHVCDAREAYSINRAGSATRRLQNIYGRLQPLKLVGGSPVNSSQDKESGRVFCVAIPSCGQICKAKADAVSETRGVNEVRLNLDENEIVPRQQPFVFAVVTARMIFRWGRSEAEAAQYLGRGFKRSR